MNLMNRAKEPSLSEAQEIVRIDEDFRLLSIENS